MTMPRDRGRPTKKPTKKKKEDTRFKDGVTKDGRIRFYKGGMREIDLTHARHDRAHCLAPGLFRPLRRGDRKKLKLDTTYNYGDRKIQFVGPYPLGADDLRILQGLIALSGPRGLYLRPEEKEADKQLQLFLELEGQAEKQHAMVVEGSFRELARVIGLQYGGGKTTQSIKESLRRLYAVTVFVSKMNRHGEEKEAGFRLLAFYESDEATNDLHVALNPRITRAIVGKVSYTHVPLDDIRELETDNGRILHQRLCALVDPGKSRLLSRPKLLSYLWPEGEEETWTKPQRYHRRKALGAAIAEINALDNWRVEDPGNTGTSWRFYRRGIPRSLPTITMHDAERIRLELLELGVTPAFYDEQVDDYAFLDGRDGRPAFEDIASRVLNAWPRGKVRVPDSRFREGLRLICEDEPWRGTFVALQRRQAQQEALFSQGEQEELPPKPPDFQGSLIEWAAHCAKS